MGTYHWSRPCRHAKSGRRRCHPSGGRRRRWASTPRPAPASRCQVSPGTPARWATPPWPPRWAGHPWWRAARSTRRRAAAARCRRSGTSSAARGPPGGRAGTGPSCTASSAGSPPSKLAAPSCLPGRSRSPACCSCTADEMQHCSHLLALCSSLLTASLALFLALLLFCFACFALAQGCLCLYTCWCARQPFVYDCVASPFPSSTCSDLRQQQRAATAMRPWFLLFSRRFIVTGRVLAPTTGEVQTALTCGVVVRKVHLTYNKRWRYYHVWHFTGRIFFADHTCIIFCVCPTTDILLHSLIYVRIPTYGMERPECPRFGLC